MRRRIQIMALAPALLLASTLAAEEPEKRPESESRAVKWAVDTAKVAGAATYCAMDEKIVEEYIAQAQVKIAALAKDKVDRVVARIEFTNVYSVASSQEPQGGCAIFRQLFAQEASKLN